MKGRRRQSALMQQLKGDPRKRGRRRVSADVAADQKAQAQAAAPISDGKPASEVLAPPKFEIPDYLTGAREKLIFERTCTELMPMQIVRRTDFGLVARYAVYMSRWIRAKERTDEFGGDGWYETDSTAGAGGVKMLRRFPGVVDMLDFGQELTKMEIALGLTPLSRQNILRGLQTLPKGVGGLFDDRPRVPNDEQASAAEAPTEAPAGPRGFLSPRPANEKLN